MREMFEFLKLLNKPFYVLSGSTYLRNSGIMIHPLYKGAIAIEKKNDLFKYTLDDISNENNKILVCQDTGFFLNFIVDNIELILKRFSEIILFFYDENYNKETIFTFISNEDLKKLKKELF